LALSTLSGSGSPLNMSRAPAAMRSAHWPLTSSPSTTATFSCRPSASIRRISASAQPRGWMPPALLTTLMRRAATSRITERMATSTKSVA
jgi:hypothetical protein